MENRYDPECAECKQLAYGAPLIGVAGTFIIGLFFATQKLKWVEACLITLPVAYVLAVWMNKRLPMPHKYHQTEDE